MTKKAFFIGALLLGALFIGWQLKIFLGFRKQQSIDKTETADSSLALETKKTITIANNIESSMLQYKHWSGTYEPTTFIITINGQEIKSNTQHTVTITNDQLAIRFDYSFLNGQRKGAKIVNFKVDADAPLLNLSFSWTNPWQVIIDNATPYEEENEAFNDVYLT